MNTPIPVKVLISQYLETLQLPPDTISDKEKQQELDRLRHEILCQDGIELFDKAMETHQDSVQVTRQSNLAPLLDSISNESTSEVKIRIQFGRNFWICSAISALIGTLPVLFILGEVGKINKLTECQVANIRVNNEDQLSPIQKRIKELGGTPPATQPFPRVSFFECNNP